MERHYRLQEICRQRQNSVARLVWTVRFDGNTCTRQHHNKPNGKVFQIQSLSL